MTLRLAAAKKYLSLSFHVSVTVRTYINTRGLQEGALEWGTTGPLRNTSIDIVPQFRLFPQPVIEPATHNSRLSHCAIVHRKVPVTNNALSSPFS